MIKTNNAHNINLYLNSSKNIVFKDNIDTPNQIYIYVYIYNQNYCMTFHFIIIF